MRDDALEIRTYGTAGPLVVVLHGGPGAPGHMAPVARGLADCFRVLEPFQRGSGAVPLTVARHVADLHDVIESRCAGSPPALAGSSWGAMLALAYAAEHPDTAGPLVLIGCGTFDPAARARLRSTIEERIDARLRRRIERLPEEFPDQGERLAAMARLLEPLYSCDLIADSSEGEACDARAHEETWQDMLRLQNDGAYPARFAAIRSPVLMMHGAADRIPAQ